MTSNFPLFPKHIQLFIGGRDKNTGNFIPHISPSMPPEIMRQFVAESFDLVPVEEQDKTPSQFTNLNMEQVLNGVVQHFLEGMRTENHYVFKRFVEYDEGGIFRTFAKFYRRICKGTYLPPNDLLMGLNRLYKHYHTEFINTPDFRLNPLKQYESNPQLTENFSILINVLLISILCDFYADQEDFREENILKKDIQDIKNQIIKFLMQPPHANSDVYRQYVLWNRLFSPEKSARIERITGEVLSDTDVLNEVKNRMVCEKDFLGNELFHPDDSWGHKKYSIKLTSSLNQHFDTLLDMLGLINMVESIYLDYKARSFGNSPNPDVTPIQYQILLNEINNS